MSTRIACLGFIICALVILTGTGAPQAQVGWRTRTVAQPTPTPGEEQERVRVFTEEVRLPVAAYDDYGNFDPTLSADDLIVLEDGVQQEIKSVRRIPASVLLLLSTGGEMNPAMRASTTRETALRLMANLREGDQMAVMQFNNRVEVLQDWTGDKDQAALSVRSHIHSGNGQRLAEAITAAADFFQNQPFGNRHLVLISDGVEMPYSRASYDEAMRALNGTGNSAGGNPAWDAAVRRLLAAQATVHIISYTEFGILAFKGKTKGFKGSNAPVGSARSSGIQNAGIDPTIPPNMKRDGTSDPAYGDGINFDPQMRRLRKAYEKALKQSEQRLSALAEETGARLVAPESAAAMIARSSEVAREIGSQYVVTYVPKRPLAQARPGEYRRIQIAPRRSSVTVRSRRGYIAAPAP